MTTRSRWFLVMTIAWWAIGISWFVASTVAYHNAPATDHVWHTASLLMLAVWVYSLPWLRRQIRPARPDPGRSGDGSGARR